LLRRAANGCVGFGPAIRLFAVFGFVLPPLLQPTNPDQFWAMISGMGTIALVIVAALGLTSLLLLKRDMQNRTTREAVQSSIDHCDEMARELVPMYTEILNALRAQGLPLFVSDPSEVSFEKTEEVKKINSAIEWMGRLAPELLDKTVPLMNQLETWSMAFTHDPSLADEKVAFEPCSTVFCQTVMGLYPMFLAQRRTNPASGPYQNVVTLFQGWYAKTAQVPMLEQLKRLQVDGARLPPTIGKKS
jgi:hypothetical protein